MKSMQLNAYLTFLLNSDDDEFYDRTQKPPKKKSGENQSIETADTLLEKKEAILKEMEDTRNLLLDENKTVPRKEITEEGDELDAYMSSVSSQLGEQHGFVRHFC